MDVLDNIPFFDQSSSTARYVLGLMADEDMLFGILLERDDSGTRVVRRFSRQRGSDYSSSETSLPMPGPADEHEGEDFTLQFGGKDDSSSNLFLGSEFGELEEEQGGPESFQADSGPSPTPSFALELADILEECRDTGYTDLAVAVAQPASDVRMVELLLPDLKDSAKEPSQKKLFQLLEEEHSGPVSKERTAFVPMTPTSEEVPRYMAIVGKQADALLQTLEGVREQDVAELPQDWLIDTEVTLYHGLARSILKRADRNEPEAEERNTLLVRVGEEDTLVLFMRGDKMHHSEVLPSLSAFDAPETICSRVLLLQDEYGIGDMDRVLLIGTEGEADLLNSFEMFFSEAEVESLRDRVPEPEDDNDTPSTLYVPAIGAALRLTSHGGFQGFLPVNLMPKGLMRRGFSIPVTWPVPVLCILLFAVTLFFMGRFFALEGDKRQVQQELQQFPDRELIENPNMMQAEIDSMQNVAEGYLAGLEALDELLVGSDQWSRSLADISRQTAAVNGAWVENWQPNGENSITLVGNATSRDNVVELAERTEGEIQQVVFSEIREWPVFSFTIDVPLPNELPEATQYLRQRMAEHQAEMDEEEREEFLDTPASTASFENDE